MWESGALTGPLGQWIRLGFTSRLHPGVITVAFTDSTALGPAVTRVVVSTAAGSRADPVRATGFPQDLVVPPGPTSWLRITVTGLASRPDPVVGAQAGINEISVPGVHASRVIAAPRVPSARPAAFVLAKAQPLVAPCMRTPARWVCSPALARPGEEQYGFDEALTAPAAAPVTVRGTAALIAPWLVNHYLRLAGGQPRVGASSRYIRAPQDQPRAAFDGDPATTWIASPGDAHPVLTIHWRHRRTVRAVTIQRPPGAAGPLQVLISGSRGQVRGGAVGPGGILRFAPIRTRSLAFRFTPVQAPLEISGVAIPGVPALQTPSGPFRLPCGFGPVVELNGRTLATRVTGTFAELFAGQPMPFTACRGVSIAAGANRVFEPAHDPFDVQDVMLAVGGGAPGSGMAGSGTAGSATAGGGALGPAPGPAAAAVVRSWAPARRVLSVAPAARSYLVVNENFNPGWQARAGGKLLRAVRIDGWKQAWLLPAGTAGTVILTYPPDTLYRHAIFGGLGSLALVMLVALWPGQPAWRPQWFARLGRSLPRRRKPPEQRVTGSGAAAVEAAPRPAVSAAGSAAAVPAKTVPAKTVPARTVPEAAAAAAAGTAAERPEARPRAAGHEAAGPENAGVPGSPRPRARWRPEVRPRLAAVLIAAATVCCLALAGLWLGGYPGAVILPAAAALFAVADSYRHARPWWYQLSRPRVPAALLLAAAACGVVGGQLVLDGTTGTVVTALANTAPQVICLVVVGRLAAALVVGDP